MKLVLYLWLRFVLKVIKLCETSFTVCIPYLIIGQWTVWLETSLQKKSTYLSSLDQFQSLHGP